MKKLSDIYQNYQSPDGHGDKGTAHTYIEEYQKLLEPYRVNSTVLEIGLFMGESLRMWEEYFINSEVIGMDITSKYLNELIEEGSHNIIITDATKPEVLNIVKDKVFDVIIDDGSHILRDQIKTFNIFKKRMKPNGIYIIEDVLEIDEVKDIFISLHDNCQIIDNRHIKDRDDDVLIIYKF